MLPVNLQRNKYPIKLALPQPGIICWVCLQHAINCLVDILILLWEIDSGSFVGIPLDGGLVFWCNLQLSWLKSRHLGELEVALTGELSCDPDEWLLKVVVGLGGDIVVLQVLLAVESDGLCLDLTLLDVNLVTAEDDWDVLADTDQVTMPVWNVLVGNTGSNIEHDDTALAVDIITVSKTTKLLLTGGIPDLEFDLSVVGVETERMDLNTHGGDVSLLKLTSYVTLDKGGLSSSSITNEDELECWDSDGHCV